MRWIPVLPVCSALVFFTVQALGQTAVVTTPTDNQTVTQPAGTTFSINSLSIPGTLSISGDRTAMIQQTQTAPMPSDGSQQDVGGILYIDDDLRDFGVSSPAAYMKIRSIPIFPDYPPYFQAVRGTQLEFGTANGIYGRVPATTALTIDPNGLVGIGTTTPQNPLSLLYGINVDQNDQNPGFMFRGPQQSFGITFGDSSGEGIGSARVMGSPNYYGLDFFTSFQNRLSITNGGAVGIGTTLPTATLEVNGNAQIDGNIAVQSITFPGGGTLTSPFPANLSSSNGNTGIGTASPSSTLEVAANAPSTLGPNLTLTNQANTVGDQEAVTFKSGPYVRAQILSTVVAGASTYSGNIDFQTVGSYQSPLVSRLFIADQGNVGIGTKRPGETLQYRNSSNNLVAYTSTGPIVEINGTLALSTGTGASMLYADGTVQSTAWNGTTLGGDYAESVDVTGDRTLYEPGDVIVINPAMPGSFDKAASSYSRMVAGIYSTKPGLVGRRTTADRPNKEAEVPMAMMGIVPTKVSTENGSIEPGDLLVSSSTPGYAMKGTDHERLTGAILGKALAPLKSGSGVIEVLLALQ